MHLKRCIHYLLGGGGKHVYEAKHCYIIHLCQFIYHLDDTYNIRRGGGFTEIPRFSLAVPVGWPEAGKQLPCSSRQSYS